MEVEAASPAPTSFLMAVHVQTISGSDGIQIIFPSLKKKIGFALATWCECSIQKLNSAKFPFAVL
jgi:hypothetical protein